MKTRKYVSVLKLSTLVMLSVLILSPLHHQAQAAPTGQAASTLGAAAARSGRYFGTAISTGHLGEPSVASEGGSAD